MIPRPQLGYCVRRMSSPGTSNTRRFGAFLLVLALALPLTAETFGSACCVMQAPCCPQAVRAGEPLLSEPIPGCCQSVSPTDRNIPGERRASGPPAPVLALVSDPAPPAPQTVAAAVATGA